MSTVKPPGAHRNVSAAEVPDSGLPDYAPRGPELEVPNAGLFPFEEHRDVGANDRALVDAMIEGAVSVAEGMHRIAYSGGWPVKTNDGFLFATPAGPDGPFAVAGDHNGWQPEAMERRGDLYVLEVRGDVDRYKLVNAHGHDFADPNARRYVYDDHGEMSLARSEGAHLERWPAFTNGIVAPRELRVWVPKKESTHHLYAFDGQNLFDPNGVRGGWHLNESLGEHTLAVGIDTAAGRFHDLTHVQDYFKGELCGGGGDAFADFIRHDVRRHIESRYGAPKKVGVLGSSLGGLMAYHVAHRFPSAYDFIGSMSGTFTWGKKGGADQETMIERYGGARFRRPTFYLDSGGGPGGGDNYQANVDMAAQLEAVGLVHGKKLFHWHEVGAEHNEEAWAARVWRPLRLFESL